jgi:large subunit ribosomal protein L23
MNKKMNKTYPLKSQQESLNQSPAVLNEWKNLLKSSVSPVTLMANMVKHPVITEKTYLAMFKHRQYTFDVDPKLTKPQIKSLIENLFNVNIIGINTHRPPRQKVRVGTMYGFRPCYKRVIITLKEGQSISFDTN